ncbi:hypothetical protein F5B19DRAFT_498506 [Rostrohypoxylon terebratum]|nr:hypothetical protein F5B19DRAFT_498506 [Rostrohypoxylon terebratum]
MKTFAILFALASGLALAAPVVERDEKSLQSRGYAALFCAGLCAPLIETPPAYAACVTACLATGNDGGEVFDARDFIEKYEEE